MIEPGFYKLSSDKYHSSNGISRSFLKRLIDDPPNRAILPVKVTDDMQFGTDFHTAILEPERFDNEYVVLPDNCLIGSGEGQRSRKAEFEEKAKEDGKTIIKPEKLDTLKRMREAVYSDPIASEYLKAEGVTEHSGYWYDPDRKDILCKFRADKIITSDTTIIDLKKTADANPEHYFFKKVAYDKGYDMESGWYLYGATLITGVEHRIFKFIACEDSEPWNVHVYSAPEEFINHGLVRCQRAFKIYEDCVDSGKWPGFPMVETPLELPAWVMRKEGYGDKGALWE